MAHVFDGGFLAEKRKRPAGLQHALFDFGKGIEALLSRGRFELRHGNQLSFQIPHAHLAAFHQNVSPAFNQLIQLAMVVKEANDGDSW